MPTKQRSNESQVGVVRSPHEWGAVCLLVTGMKPADENGSWS